MNNFIFENATKTFFGKGCVKEYLTCLSSRYGQTVMLAYGGGSIKKNGVLLLHPIQIFCSEEDICGTA